MTQEHTTIRRHKRGDTFSEAIPIPASIPDGYFAGWAMAAQVRDSSGNLVHTLQATWDDPVVTRVILLTSFPAPTTEWPIDSLGFDVQFTRPDGTVTSTNTLTIICTKDQTYV